MDWPQLQQSCLPVRRMFEASGDTSYSIAHLRDGTLGAVEPLELRQGEPFLELATAARHGQTGIYVAVHAARLAYGEGAGESNSTLIPLVASHIDQTMLFLSASRAVEALWPTSPPKRRLVLLRRRVP